MRYYNALKVGQAKEFMSSSRLSCKKNAKNNFSQIVFVKYNIDELMYLLDVMKFANKVIAQKLTCYFLKKINANNNSLLFFFLFESGRVGSLETTETKFLS